MLCLSPTLRDRFEGKVDRSGGPDACHPWTASTNGRGYGQIYAGHDADGNDRRLGSHVVAALLAGRDPLGKVVRHECDNPPCCNDRHLLVGTQADNLADMRAKGRGAFGARCAASKLTEDEVRAIRSAVAEGATQTATAMLYGVSRATVGYIVSRQRWQHVADVA